MRRIERYIDIMHALKLQRLRYIHFDDDHISRLHIGSRIAHGSRRNDIALFRDCAGLDDGYIDFAAEIAIAGQLGRFAQMQVAIIDLTGIDLCPQRLICLVRHAESNAMCLGQGTIKFLASRCTSPQIDFKGVLLHALSQRQRNRLRIPGRGESARTNIHARLDVSGSFLRGYDLRLQFFVAYAIENINH